jgi:hypothetical protein
MKKAVAKKEDGYQKRQKGGDWTNARLATTLII